MNPPAESPAPDNLQSAPDELHLALVRPLGVKTGEFVDHLRAVLAQFNFSTELVKLSDFIDQFGDAELPGKEEDRFGYYRSRMDLGDQLRGEHGPEVLSLFAAREAAKRRAGFNGGTRGVAFVYDSVMHPAEVKLLRQIYGSLFFLVAIHADEEACRAVIEQRLAPTSFTDAADHADQLVNRDRGRGQGKKAKKSSLSFEGTFHQADLFLLDVSGRTIEGLSGEHKESSDPALRRFVRQVFDYPHGVPTREETAMSMAYAASLRSGALSRRVGAAICRPDRNEIIATGCNDVPRFAGGLYDGEDGEDDERDAHRVYTEQDFGILKETVQGADSNDLVKLELLANVLGLVRGKGRDLDRQELLEELDRNEDLLGARLLEIITYGRTVHAEMDAITTAARFGLSVKDGLLFTTTFPCHECTRHIISSGVREVVYVEPYPKSKAVQLHSDAVTLELETGHGGSADQVIFRPFVGISPSRHDELYSAEDRKLDSWTDLDSYGRAIQWVPGPSAKVRYSIIGDPTLRDHRLATVWEAEKPYASIADRVETALGMSN